MRKISRNVAHNRDLSIIFTSTEIIKSVFSILKDYYYG